MHNDLTLSLTHLKPNKNNTVNNFAYLEQQSGQLRLSKQWPADRWGRQDRQVSTTIPLIPLSAEGTPSLFSIFSLQTLPSAHESN